MILCLFSSEPCSHLFIYYIYINDLGLSSRKSCHRKSAPCLCAVHVGGEQAASFWHSLFMCRQLGVSHRRQQQAACFSCVCVFLLQLVGVSKASSSSSAAVGSSAARCTQTGQRKRWRRRAGIDLSEQIDFLWCFLLRNKRAGSYLHKGKVSWTRYGELETQTEFRDGNNIL